MKKCNANPLKHHVFSEGNDFPFCQFCGIKKPKNFDNKILEQNKMKKTYEICYSNSFKINKGNFEQESPFYSQKVVIESEDDLDVKAEYAKLRAIVDELATAQYNSAKLDQSGLRIRIKDGKKYVSVTSILGGGKKLDIDPEYGIRGTELHRLFNIFVDTSKWEAPKVPLTKMTYEDIKYKEFFEEHGANIDFSVNQKNIEVFHPEHLYSGEIDIVCFVNKIKTLADFKSGSWSWEQLVAYYKALNDAEIKQLAVFDVKKGKLEVIAVNDPKARKAWESFLKKRGAIEATFGV